MGEKFVMFVGWSTYNYVMNNPVRLVDPTGMLASEVEDFSGGAKAPLSMRFWDAVGGTNMSGEWVAQQMISRMSSMGINGGFSVTNNSKESLLVFGNSLEINSDGSGEVISPSNSVLLEPGQKLVPTFTPGYNDDGSVKWSFNGNVIDTETGIIISNVGIYDIDGASLNTLQTVEENGKVVAVGGLSMPYEPGFPGEIKFQSGYSSAIDDRVLGHPTPSLTNQSDIEVISTQNGHIMFKTTGINIISKPIVKYGKLLRQGN